MFPEVSRHCADFETVTDDRRRKCQATLIPKYSAEDTTLCAGNGTGETITFPVPAGTVIKISVPGLHYNREGRIVRGLDRGSLRGAG